MKRLDYLYALIVAMSCASLGRAALIEEFLFNDASGTALPATANSVPGGHSWADDLQGDLGASQTNGLGQYSVAKTNNELGTALVNNSPNITSATVYGVMEMTWAFDLASLNTAENEEIRLSIINLDTAGSSSVTAEFALIRQDDNTVTLAGVAVGTGSSNIPSVLLSMTQATKFIGVVGANLNDNTYWVYYSQDAGATFATLKGGTLDPARIGAQLRMVLNNDLSQDNVLIDRVALSTTNPFPNQIQSIPEPSTVSLMLLATASLGGMRRRA